MTEQRNAVPRTRKAKTGRAAANADQRPYVTAFRNFILNPENRDAEGRPWTARPVLEALWDLWTEKTKTDRLFVDFEDRYSQRIFRYRQSVPTATAPDPLLFKLILRFLELHKVVVPPVDIVRSIGRISSSAWAIAPVGRVLPVFDKDGEGIRLYKITPQVMAQPGETGPYLMALLLARRSEATCPVMVFSQTRMDVSVGLFFFLAGECFVRLQDTYIYYRYAFGGFPKLRPSAGAAATARVTGQQAVAMTLEPAQHPEGILYQSYCTCERVEDADALTFAQRYLSHFIFDN